jgi:hypothetical protein
MTITNRGFLPFFLENDMQIFYLFHYNMHVATLV